MYDSAFSSSLCPDHWMDGPAGEGTFVAFCNHIEDGRYVCLMEHTDCFLLRKKMKSAYYLLKDNRREGQSEAASIELEHTMKPFSIPSNLYMLMTSSDTLTEQDRDTSIFHTRQLHAKETELDNIIIKGISLRYLVEAMNKRLAYLISPEYQIGHHCFDSLRNNKTLEALGDIMYEVIVPKLLTWFTEWEDSTLYHGSPYEGLRLVFGDYKKSNKSYEMITKEMLNPTVIFGMEMEMQEKVVYKINRTAFYELNSYLELE